MKNIFKSDRFWLLIIVGFLQVLVIFKVIDGAQAEALTQVVQTIILGVVGIRTADRLGDKKVEAAKITHN